MMGSMKARELVERFEAIPPKTIESVLAVGFGSAFGAYTIELLQRGMYDGASWSSQALVVVAGLAAISQSRRCARIVFWILTNDDPR